MADAVTVVLADDHALVRDMLRERLNHEGIHVAACAGSADEAVSLSVQFEPDVLILDIDMPGRCAFDAAREVLASVPTIRVLFLSAFVHDHYVQQALAAAASGYLTKSEPSGVVVEAVRRVAAGATQFSADVTERLVIDTTGARLAATSRSRVELLTDREREILGYVARGFLQKQIANLMGLSIKTVQTHISHLMDKLEIHDRVELARYAIREGLVEA
jgi:DNA-binding NarL/FixJ family response regulator